MPNPELEGKIETILSLIEELKAMEGGEAALLEKLNPPAEGEAALLEKLNPPAEGEEPETKKVEKELANVPSKGVVAQDDPKKTFTAELPEEVVSGVNDIKKSVMALCDVVKGIQKDNEICMKAINGVLGSMGVKKSEIEAAVSFKPIQNLESVRKSLESMGYKVEKAEVEKAANTDASPFLVKKSATISDNGLAAMVVGKPINTQGVK